MFLKRRKQKIHVIVNYVDFPKDSQKRKNQEIAMESAEALRDKTNFIAASEIEVPGWMKFIGPPQRNAVKVLHAEKKLPFVRDLFSVGLQGIKEGDLFVYANSDVIFEENFCERLHKLFMAEIDLIRMKSQHIDQVNSLKEALNAPLQKEMKYTSGYEAFAFTKSALQTALGYMPDFLLGECYWDIWMREFLKNILRTVVISDLIRHIVHPITWGKHEKITTKYNSLLYGMTVDDSKIPASLWEHDN